MGKRLGSYKDLGNSGGAAWLDSWKEDGLLICVLHRDPPWMRGLHNFRKIVKEETKDGVTLKVAWFPFVCWEDDDYHRLRRLEKKNPPQAKKCPACRLIEHIEQRDDLADDEPIFIFKAGRDKREIVKVDLIGKGEGKQSYQDDLTCKTDFVLPVIPYADPSRGVCLTNEKWSLGQALISRIKKDISMYGEEEGDPEKTPIVYTFEYDKKNQKYGVSRYAKPVITDEIRALWEGPSPDADRFVRHGNPVALLEAMKVGIVVDNVPLDEIFAPAIADWDGEEEERADFDPDKLEDEKPQAKTKANGHAKTPEKPQREAKVDKPATEKASEKSEEKPAERPTRATRKADPPPPPPPKKDVIVYACEACGADWPEDQPKCPGCGLEAAPAEPEPPKAGKGKSAF